MKAVMCVGLKAVNATAMTLGEYNKVQGWGLPEGQDPAAAGYLVEYLDGGKPTPSSLLAISSA